MPGENFPRRCSRDAAILLKRKAPERKIHAAELMADKPKRVWRIAHSESSTGWGGQEHRVMAELTGFQGRGSQVWLVAPAESRIFRRAQKADVSTVPLRPEKWRFPFEVIRIARWLKEQRVGVVNTHSSRDGWLVGIAARMARVPFVVRTRHIDVSYPFRWLSRHAFTTLADHILTTSGRITDHFRDIFHLPEDRISTVPTGIDMERFSPAGPKADLIGPSATAAVPLIGMVSVLRSWKGHSTFLQAAELLRSNGVNGRFVIVGEGPMRRQIEKQVRELQLADRFTLAGHREDVPEILRALSVLVIASTRHEGVPQIGLQALATKTPVVGSDTGGIPEIIRPGETGRIFPAGDAKALAQTIRDALEQPETTGALAERGRVAVEARHSLVAMLDTLDALYRRHIPLAG
jgi:glycosyltransferase involved in cell wall biosynthesis